MRVLWVTNDLPPRAGGIEQFVGSLLARVHPESAVVIGPAGPPGAARHDLGRPWRTIRAPGRVLPTPRVRRLIAGAAQEQRPEVVVLGASWPLGELAPWLRAHLGVPVVALSHGLEAGLVSAGLGRLVRRASRGLAALTTISEFTERRLARHVAAERLVRLPPGVDVERFRPGLDGRRVRASWGVPETAPLVGCVSRLVRRKGQDTLLEAWAEVRHRHPDAWLVLAGEGPLERWLRRRAESLGGDGRVAIPGRVPGADLPEAYAALDVFAMPCRTRWAGLDVEGLGIVYLEAQASEVAVVAGDSGGAGEAVRAGRTGAVVDGRDVGAVSAELDRLLSDAGARARMGAEGRRWVERHWSWEAIAATFAGLLDELVDAD